MPYHEFLSPELATEAMTQTHSIWGGNLSLEVRIERQRKRLADAGPSLYQMSGLTNDDGTLICSLKRYYFFVTIVGKSVKAVGLGGIFTHPEHRRQGLAAELIRTVLDESRDKYQCGTSLLYSDISPAYYQKFGFREVPAISWSIPIASLPEQRGYELR
jgi:predicted N-acetyltransferase YhbS